MPPLYLPLAFVAPFSGFQAACFIWLSALSELCGVLAQVYGSGRRYDGPMGKSDRAFFIGLAAVCYAWNGSLHGAWYWLMWLACAALAFTCWRRIRNGLQAA